MQLTLPSISLEIPRQLPPAVRGWMLGQLLDATVIGRVSENSIRLNVAGTELRAATALKLQVGDSLSLRVTQLKPVVTLAPVVVSGASEKTILHASINRILPMQRALAPTLEHVRDVVRPPATATAAQLERPVLPAAVRHAAERVLASVPRFRDVVDPAQLPRIIRQSGILAEHAFAVQLQAGGEATLPAHDLKWQLLRLRGALSVGTPQSSAAQKPPASSAESPRATLVHQPLKSPGPGAADRAAAGEAKAEIHSAATQHLARLVDSAIARIETNQLKSISALLDGNFELSVELPIVIDDAYQDIRLMVRQDGRASDLAQAESNTIVLEIPLSPEAIVRAVVCLSGEDLSVRLWSTDSELRGVLAGTRETLIDRLRANGLDKVSVTVVELKPFDQWARRFDQLVDTKA